MLGMPEEEWFDIVDEADEVVGREMRRVVHATGLRHRAVHIQVFDGDGRVFLQKRSMTKDTAPGLWDSSASGHVDSGEDYDTSAVREVGEELGWQPPAPLKRLFKVGSCADTGNEFVWVYRAEWDGGRFTLHPEEIERGEWFGSEQVDQMIAKDPEALAKSFRYIWREMKARGVM